MKPQRIVIKVGTNVLQRANGKLDYNIINDLGEQIAAIHKMGVEVLFVTSGAVGAGREICEFEDQKRTLIRKQILASVGQVRLMQIYSDFFLEHQIIIAQILLTRSHFGDRSSYLNIRNTLDGLLDAGILPVINENDVVATEELALNFGDNDQLAVYVAALAGADHLFFLTTAPGLLKFNDAGEGELVPEVQEYSDALLKLCKPTKSSGGTGGMDSKIKSAGLGASFGIETHIVDGKAPNVVLKILKGEKQGTRFIPNGKKIKSYQKWLAAGAMSKGKLVIDAGAEQALRNNKSLLIRGIRQIEGSFELKDLVTIYNLDGKKIGVGQAKMSHKELKDYLNTTTADNTSAGKIAIHCDQLFLE
ncbi:MAG: glutamate 5-kinase [SAR324 cluster bacterium]|nr:glutamate 5-kinase [SAR324 cluster bacterium]